MLKPSSPILVKLTLLKPKIPKPEISETLHASQTYPALRGPRRHDLLLLFAPWIDVTLSILQFLRVIFRILLLGCHVVAGINAARAKGIFSCFVNISSEAT